MRHHIFSRSTHHMFPKAFLLFLFCLFLSGQISSQVIGVNPPLPTAGQAVDIILNTQGTELEGYQGNIYVHTGVNNWQHVIGSWGNNNTQPRAFPIGNNLYRLEIRPDIRAFYNVPAATEISRLAMVFRSADGSRQTRPDIFVDVNPPGLRTAFISPSGLQNIVELTEFVDIRAAANESDSLVLYINQQRFESTTTGQIALQLQASFSGRIDLRAIAYGQSQTAEASAHFFVRPDVTSEPLPQGVRNGINYINNQTVTLVLHDPPAKKQHAFVLGDFNNWSVGEESYMKRSPDGKHFWITISGLTPGREYAFQYLVDGDLRLADPYADKILDPWHDEEIASSPGRYPGLIPYPVGKTNHAVSVLQPGREPYQWKNNAFVPPPAEDLVIYELLIRDFLENNTYATLKDTLGYLKNLGINAIELLPVTHFEGNQSWGYNPAFFFAPDKYYGPRRKLKEFIDEAHGMGMAVITDMVWNHSYGQSPLLRMYYDQQNNRPSNDNPWYSDPIFANPAMNFGYKFDHGSPYFIEFMDRANKHWLEEYRVDGFRFDLTKGFTTRFKGPSDPWGSLYDQERVDNLVRMYQQIKTINPNAYVILEHLADNPEETVLANNGMMLWGNLSHAYQEASMGWLQNSNFDWISWQRRNWNAPQVIGYMESHDEERILFKNLNFGNESNADHNTRNLDIALHRGGLLATFFFTIPGPKMIWQFGEMGYDYSINRCPNGTISDGCRTSPKPVRWDYLEVPSRRRLHDIYAALIRLKTENEVFRTNDFQLALGGAMKRIHLNHPEQKVTILGNFGVSEAEINPNFQETGRWHEFFTRRELQVQNVNQPILLRPGEYHIYSTSPFPHHGMPIEDIREEGSIQVFPNPSSRGIYFETWLPVDGQVSLDIYSLSGMRVFSHSEPAKAGNYDFFWDASANPLGPPPPGIYLYRLMAGDTVHSGKISIVR